MITDDERFKKIQGILAMSDIHFEDCTKITDLIIELSHEKRRLENIIKNAKRYVQSHKYVDLNYNPEEPWDWLETRDDLLEILEGNNE